jgi:hypothetical protein
VSTKVSPSWIYCVFCSMITGAAEGRRRPIALTSKGDQVCTASATVETISARVMSWPHPSPLVSYVPLFVLVGCKFAYSAFTSSNSSMKCLSISSAFSGPYGDAGHCLKLDNREMMN